MLACSLIYLPAYVLSETPLVYDLFKWGEYDSLVKALEPVIADWQNGKIPKNKLDSTEAAKSYLLIGAGYFGTDRLTMADSAFTFVCRLDKSIRLDRFYVSKKMADFFDSTWIMEKTRGASAVATHTDSNLVRRKSHAHEWLKWGTGVVATAATLGGTYLILSHPQEKKTTVTTVIDAR